MDLIITFPEMDIVRNWKAAHGGEPEHAARFDWFFGSPAWRDALDSARPSARTVHSLIRFYAAQLKGFGYQTSVLPLTMKNKKRGTLYRPIFASRHSRGIDFWEKISRSKEPSGQGRLL